MQQSAGDADVLPAASPWGEPAAAERLIEPAEADAGSFPEGESSTETEERTRRSRSRRGGRRGRGRSRSDAIEADPIDATGSQSVHSSPAAVPESRTRESARQPESLPERPSRGAAAWGDDSGVGRSDEPAGRSRQPKVTSWEETILSLVTTNMESRKRGDSGGGGGGYRRRGSGGEGSRGDAGRSDAGRSDAGRSDAGRSDTGRSDAGRGEKPSSGPARGH
jgi:hypothetical protein